jgi:hypothetical protein
MPRAKKQVEETEVKKTTVKKASPKKTTTKKKVTTKTVKKASRAKTAKFASLDDISVEEFVKITKDQLQAEKFVQLINDYKFEKDQTERIRCVAIAFGNWRHGFEFDPDVSSKENFESHNFEKAKKILNDLVNS